MLFFFFFFRKFYVSLTGITNMVLFVFFGYLSRAFFGRYSLLFFIIFTRHFYIWKKNSKTYFISFFIYFENLFSSSKFSSSEFFSSEYFSLESEEISMSSIIYFDTSFLTTYLNSSKST